MENPVLNKIEKKEEDGSAVLLVLRFLVVGGRSSRTRARLRKRPSSPLLIAFVKAEPQGHGLCPRRRPRSRPHRSRRRRGIFPPPLSTNNYAFSGGNSSRGSGTGVAFCDSVLDSGFRALEARGLDRWSLEGICPSGDWGSAIVADLQFGLVIG